MRDWLRLNWSGLGVGLTVAAVVLIASWFWRTPTAPITVVMPTLVPSPTPSVVVHVTGAVRSPGVYTLVSGARITDALEQAGGVLEGGDPGALNLAARLTDGQRIEIPLQGEVRASTASTRINVNRASRPELESLPGIGAATALRILEHRERNGPFQSIEQLRELKIIPSQTADRLRDLVVFD